MESETESAEPIRKRAPGGGRKPKDPSEKRTPRTVWATDAEWQKLLPYLPEQKRTLKPKPAS